MPGTYWNAGLTPSGAAASELETFLIASGWWSATLEEEPNVHVMLLDHDPDDEPIESFDNLTPSIYLRRTPAGALPDGWQDAVRQFLSEHDPSPRPTNVLNLLDRMFVDEPATPDPATPDWTTATYPHEALLWNKPPPSNLPRGQAAVGKESTAEFMERVFGAGPPATTGSHVFVSYSRDDQEYVDRLVAHLTARNVTCWIDKSGIDYGDRWRKEIEENLESCAAFVVVMTPASHRSKWVKREIAYAEKRGKPTLPLLLEGEEFFDLIDLQYESVVGGTMPPDRWVERLRLLTGS